MAKHFIGNEKSVSPILTDGSVKSIATLAQLVEHVFRKDGVRSSILRGGSRGDSSIDNFCLWQDRKAECIFLSREKYEPGSRNFVSDDEQNIRDRSCEVAQKLL